MIHEKTKSRQISAALIFVLGLAVLTRIWGISFGLPHMYHIDENRFAKISLNYFTGDLNPHFFHVPTLHTYTVAGIWGVYYLGGKALGTFEDRDDFMRAFERDPTVFMLLGRLLTALLSIGTILVVYLIGARMYDPRVGLLAALFLIFSPVHNKISHYMVPDVPMLFFMMLTFLFIWQIYKKGLPRYYLLAGLFAGLASATKYGGQMLFLPLFLAHLFRQLEDRTVWWKIIFNLKLISSGLVFIAAFVVTSPYMILDFQRFWKDFQWQSKHLYQTGHFGSSTAEPAWIFYLREGFRENIGLISQFLVLGGLVLGFVRHKQREIILFSYPLVLFFMVGGWKAKAVRYLMPMTPFFILIAAGFLGYLLSLWLKSSPAGAAASRKRQGRILLAGAVILVLLFHPAKSIFRFDIQLGKKDTRTLAAEWISDSIPEETVIALEMYGPPISREDEKTLYRHSLSAVSLEWLHQHQAEYVIVSDIMYSRFIRFPEEFPREAAFYRSLETEAALVKTFTPKWDEPLIDLHNPTLKVYKLSRYPDMNFPGNFDQYSQRIELIRKNEAEWNLRASLQVGATIEGDEVVRNPYLRLEDESGEEIGRLLIHEGQLKAEGGALTAGTEIPWKITGQAKIFAGYEYTFPFKGMTPEKTARKERMIAEIDPRTLAKRDSLSYLFMYSVSPQKHGDEYSQIITMSKEHAVWNLSTEVYGGEMRWGDDYVRAPFVRILDAEGRLFREIPVFKGTLGSYQADRKTRTRKSLAVPQLPGEFKIRIGYAAYFDKQTSAVESGPESREMIIPPAIID